MSLLLHTEWSGAGFTTSKTLFEGYMFVLVATNIKNSKYLLMAAGQDLCYQIRASTLKFTCKQHYQGNWCIQLHWHLSKAFGMECWE